MAQCTFQVEWYFVEEDSQEVNCRMSTNKRGERSARLVRPFEKNLNLTIIGPTRTFECRTLTINSQTFGPTKIGVVGPAPPALTKDPVLTIYSQELGTSN